MQGSILVVEDDHDVADVLIRTLIQSGYDVVRVATGAEAVHRVVEWAPDVVLLDLGLPDLDGLEVCRRIRASGYRSAVVVVSARGHSGDVRRSYAAGANDFITKPFGLAELQARVSDAVRGRGRRSPALRLATASGLMIDTAARRAQAGPFELRLTGKEFDVLALLAASEGELVTTESLIARVWASSEDARSPVVQSTVQRLRRKLDSTGAVARIEPCTSADGSGFVLGGA